MTIFSRSLFSLLFLITACPAAILPEFQEQSLSSYAGPKGEAYRVCSEPFGDSPYMVRIVFDGKDYFLATKQLSGEGLYYRGTLVSTWQAKISERQWKGFLNLVDQSSFWKKQSHVQESDITDGSNDSIEGYKNGRELALERHCIGALPEDKGLERMAIYFMKFSREQAILRRDPYYSSPVSTSDGKAILIGIFSDYRSKH